MGRLELLFVISAFSLQFLLFIYFIARKMDFQFALRYGWLVYALGIPAAFISMVLMLSGKNWSYWLGGFLFGAWAVYGYIVDIREAIPWRNPIHPPVFFPYVILYLSAQMFYWWPLGAIKRPLWFLYAALFAVSSYFNWTSHGN